MRYVLFVQYMQLGHRKLHLLAKHVQYRIMYQILEIYLYFVYQITNLISFSFFKQY
jgi:hypothetical protein